MADHHLSVLTNWMQHSENTQRTLREHSDYTQRTPREHLEHIQRTLKAHSEPIAVLFKWVGIAHRGICIA